MSQWLELTAADGFRLSAYRRSRSWHTLHIDSAVYRLLEAADHTDSAGAVHRMDFVIEALVSALRWATVDHNCRRILLHRLPGFDNRDKSCVDLLLIAPLLSAKR